MESVLTDANIVETNIYYYSDCYTTEQHLETLKVNVRTFANVDIIDSEGTTMLPVKGTNWFTEMSLGKTILDYDSLFVLLYFKGHT